MSVRIMTAVFAADLPDIDIVTGEGSHTVKASTAKFVLLALADCANDEGKGAYPRIETLARKTSMTRRTIQRTLEALMKMEYIHCVGTSEYFTSNYSIMETRIPPIYGGDSGAKLIEGGDSGATKSAPESPESLLNPLLTTTTNGGSVFRVFEAEIGVITPKISWEINDFLDHLKCPEEWIIEAINLASTHNKRNWAYCVAILKRWLVEGKQAMVPAPQPPGQKYPKGNGKNVSQANRTGYVAPGPKPVPTAADIALGREVIRRNKERREHAKSGG